MIRRVEHLAYLGLILASAAVADEPTRERVPNKEMKYPAWLRPINATDRCTDAITGVESSPCDGSPTTEYADPQYLQSALTIDESGIIHTVGVFNAPTPTCDHVAYMQIRWEARTETSFSPPKNLSDGIAPPALGPADVLVACSAELATRGSPIAHDAEGYVYVVKLGRASEIGRAHV